MIDESGKPAKSDRLKSRSDIGRVEFPIEKLIEYRDAQASCVHIEARLEADRKLVDRPGRARR